MSTEVIALLHKAIALLSGTVNEPASTDTAAARYLVENADVARHPYYRTRPLEHWQQHGQREGRRWPAVPGHPPVVARDPHADDESPQPVATGDSPELRNFNAIRRELGEDAAYDYLIKNVPGGANIVRNMFADRDESARLVNRYAIGSKRGRIEGDEYVYAPPFTDGRRVKLPG